MELWLDARYKQEENDEELSVKTKIRRDESDRVLVDDKSPISSIYDDGKTPLLVHIQGDNDQKLFTSNGQILGKVVDISTSRGQDEGLAAVGSVEWILADTPANQNNDEDNNSGAWKMIPAENLIAAARQGGTSLAVCVNRQQDIVGLSRALELGVDALCIPQTVDDSFWQAAKEAQQERAQNENDENGNKLSSKKNNDARIVHGSCHRRSTSSSSSVLAHRVCIDFVQMLEPEEGCWIGSSAMLTALVLSEAAASSLVPTRPFRVNAGPVHSYVLMGDGKTFKYLCEVEAGDEVQVYNSKTQTVRAVAVGRVKMESRPCVILDLALGQEEENIATRQQQSSFQIILQQAETVRLAKPQNDATDNANFVRVTDLTAESNETILLRSTMTGTHIGRSYTGKVIEK